MVAEDPHADSSGATPTFAATRDDYAQEPAARHEVTASRACTDCETRVEIAVNTDIMIITAHGNTCETCVPRSKKRVARTDTVPRTATTLHVWWAPHPDGSGQWHVLRQRFIDEEVQQPAVPRPDATEAQEPTSDRLDIAGEHPQVSSELVLSEGWQDPLRQDASEIFGKRDWLAIALVWGAVDCRMLGAFAVLLESFWLETVVGSDGSARMIVRLTGLPPLVAVLVPEAALRWANSDQPMALPVSGMVAVYATLGPLLCASTGHRPECTDLERLLGDASKLPEAPRTPRPTALRLALAGRSGRPAIADLLAAYPVREHAPGQAEQPPPGHLLLSPPQAAGSSTEAAQPPSAGDPHSFTRPATAEPGAVATHVEIPRKSSPTTEGAPGGDREPAQDFAGMVEPGASAEASRSTHGTNGTTRPAFASDRAHETTRSSSAGDHNTTRGAAPGADSPAHRSRTPGTVSGGRGASGSQVRAPYGLKATQAVMQGIGSAPQTAITFGRS
ncbi:hypothetical protein [Amycolatopsis camponoti]|uniref:hypothetical protein n=1 Tax=Amycolatopsis camponoti TaxID=2606593 RepID=UPI0012D7D603|nr:hypothetical protein [Amycolatopsis camponoti]